ncbi:Efflux transporter, RND family, MFP subunit [uncultured Desulfobacterium sp.]|uniref:Efflux transporter, RND family, MFP subunit n=1 Tax=uncultured Desulfobacterium sp. TaxID=201089 RepID=A0A445MVY8_9BACT|nr:Efflux transporter, RND family, MFP subunit [uncultured Desulfobacterium sp.]
MQPLIKKVLVLCILVLFGGAAASYLRNSNEQHPLFRTAAVSRGDLLATISATGTVEPEELVDVGAQVAGQINSFGKDKQGKTIDYGSAVEEATVLAQIDDSLYAADVALTAAQVQQAKAGLKRAEADLIQLKAKLYQAQRDWDRAQKLGPSSKALAETSYDAYRSDYETAKANVAVGEASIIQARAAVEQAQAALMRSQQNLGYCTIKSPVKGVIIDRRVNIGQTVVSSLNAPSLFLIAKDLTRMQVWVSVNEADIGNIRPGQPVTFTVDAYPGETFRGEVGKVRLNATMTQNVVTYTVEVTTDNRDGRLLPYLTANVEFETGRRSNVFLVPNAALRWSPRPEQISPEFRAARDGSKEQTDKVEAERQLKGGDTKTGDRGHKGLLWVKKEGYLRPVRVSVGLSDGSMTEVDGSDLKEGLEVVLGEQPKEAGNNAANPFTPQLMKGNRP